MQTILKIDPEFKAIVPPLSQDEFQQLEENIVTTGKCRDAIITWRGIIVDGHNRYAICQKHGLLPEVLPMKFPSRKEAILWIVENQLGRRNLTDAMRISLAARKSTTRKDIAAIAKVSENTVQKYMKIKAIGNPQLQKQVDNGDLKIGTAYNMLQVSTKTVKEILNPQELQDLNRQYQVSAILSTGAGLGKMYRFISKNMGYSVEDVVLIQGRLAKQGECLQRKSS